MKVVVARAMGMCFGVKDAIALAHRLADEGPLTIAGELVHNREVNMDLARRGVRIAAEARAVLEAPLGPGDPRRVLITAHGVSTRIKQNLTERGLSVFDATCPLVEFAHGALAHLVAQGFHPTVIGKADHVEVRGLVGDFDAWTILETQADVAQLEGRSRIGIVAQTTQPMDWVTSMVERVRQRYPRALVRFVDTVCQPTKARQDAILELAQAGVDMIVVAGGRNSNNSRKLVEQALAMRIPTHLVEAVDELEPSWFVRVRRVGLTAGTSTPQATIDGIQSWLEAHETFAMSTPAPIRSLSSASGARAMAVLRVAAGPGAASPAEATSRRSRAE